MHKMLVGLLSALFVKACLLTSIGVAAGPDVIVGFIDDGREDSRKGTKIGLTASTNSCNAGDAPLDWHRLPSNKHPAISMNFYRLMNGRIEQLAQSWVKHAFYATNRFECQGIPEVTRPCQDGPGGNLLRPGCSDYYGEDLNADTSHLGPRSRIENPATGEFNGSTAQDLTGYPESGPAERIMLVEEADLRSSNARYFVEAHYITADDALAGNARNNVTYREVKPILRTGAWVLRREAAEVRRQPAVAAWKEDGAQLSEIETLEGRAKSYIIIGSKANPVGGGKYRYDYVVYNMNSDLAIQSLKVPAPVIDESSIGFRSAPAHGEIWSNRPWEHKVNGGLITWSTERFEDNSKANAIRWGSTYNFWFISDAPPVQGDVTISHFKPAGSNAGAVTRAVVPGR